MNYKEISELLERYWEGETTLAEEKTLKTYFTSEGVDERLKRYMPLFQALRAEQKVELTAQPRAVPAMKIGVFRYWRYAAAASLVGVLLFVGLNYAQQREEEARIAARKAKLETDTCQTPEEAAAEIKAALALVSRKLKKGQREAAKGLQKMEAVDKYIIKSRTKKES